MKTLFMVATALLFTVATHAQNQQAPCSSRPAPQLTLTECGLNATQRKVCIQSVFTDTPSAPGGLCYQRLRPYGSCYPINGCPNTYYSEHQWIDVDCNVPETVTYTIKQIWPDGCETSDTKSITLERPCRNGK